MSRQQTPDRPARMSVYPGAQWLTAHRDVTQFWCKTELPSKVEQVVHHEVEDDQVGEDDSESSPILVGLWPPDPRQKSQQNRVGTEHENLHPTGPLRDWSEHGDNSTHRSSGLGRMTLNAELLPKTGHFRVAHDPHMKTCEGSSLPLASELISQVLKNVELCSKLTSVVLEQPLQCTSIPLTLSLKGDE